MKFGVDFLYRKSLSACEFRKIGSLAIILHLKTSMTFNAYFTYLLYYSIKLSTRHLHEMPLKNGWFCKNVCRRNHTSLWYHNFVNVSTFYHSIWKQKLVREHLRKELLNDNNFVENRRSESHTLHTNVHIFYGISSIPWAIWVKFWVSLIIRNAVQKQQVSRKPYTDSRNSRRFVN
jgi:hypothetical protein